jgi:hypothetical protein
MNDFRTQHAVFPHSLPSRVLLFFLFTFLGLARSHAAIVFYPYISDVDTAFQDAIEEEGLILLGCESLDSIEMEEWGLTPTSILAPGESAGPLFPTGTARPLGLWIQTNADGLDPVAPNPGGQIYAYRSSAIGESAWLGPNRADNGLDLFVDPPGQRGRVRALAFNVATAGGTELVARLFDNTNTEFAQHTFTVAGQSRVAVAVSGQSLFRVNLFAPSGYFDVGEIEVYVVPIPEIAAVPFLAGLLGLGALLRRRR